MNWTEPDELRPCTSDELQEAMTRVRGLGFPASWSWVAIYEYVFRYEFHRLRDYLDQIVEAHV